MPVGQLSKIAFPAKAGIHLATSHSLSGGSRLSPGMRWNLLRFSAGLRWCSAAFELGDEEDLAAPADFLEVGRLIVDRAVDRDGGFLDEVFAEAGVAAIELLEHVAHRRRFDVELPHAAGVAPAETARQRDVSGGCGSRGHRALCRG